MKKRKWKKLRFLAILIVLLITIKLYLEISANMYENNITLTQNEVDYASHVEHKQLNEDGYDIHYFTAGTRGKDLVIFLHPAFSDHHAFDQQIAHFSKSYYVITIDLIGHGLSKQKKSADKIDCSEKHINSILLTEGYQSAHIVGVSMGSLIGQYFALKHPEKVKSLTVLGGYSIHENNSEVKKAQRNSNLGLILRALFSIKSFRQKTAEISTHTPQGKLNFFKSSALFSRKSFMVMQGLDHIIMERELPKKNFNTLILTAEHDIDLAKKMALSWHSQTENSDYHQFKNAGHCANMDVPDEFNTLVEGFIQNNN